LNIGKKLTITHLLMACSIIIVALVLSRTIESIDEEFEALHDRTLEISTLLEKIRYSSLRIVSSTSEFLLIVSADQHTGGGETQIAEASNEVELVQAAANELYQLTAHYRKIVVTYFPDELELLEAIEQFRDKLVEQSQALTRIEPEDINIPMLLASKEGFEKTEQSLLQAIEAALLHESVEYAQNEAELRDSIRQTYTLVWIGLLGIAVLVLLVGSATIGGITNPLARLSQAIDAISRGEYSQALKTGRNDEIGRLEVAFDSMAAQLQNNRQLQQEFIEQMEQKNTELERFTYTVSHDLKSPLVTVKGFLGMLEKDIQAGNNDAIDKDIAYLNEATDTMGMLLTDLLELSRVGRVVNPPTLFSMTELCEEVISSLHGSIVEHQAEITLMPDMPSVYADRTRIGEVMQNLVENAIKFADESRRPRINIYSETLNGNRLFIVDDNGKGIDPQFHDKIFVLFERLEASVSGTGVGLALVKRIIETHGGEIWTESPVEAHGSRFCFTLPQPGDEAKDYRAEAV